MRDLSAVEIASAVNRNEISAEDVIEAHLESAAEADELRAVITWCGERAIEKARRRPAGPLAGVPILVKDIFDTEDVRTTYGSRIFADHVPSRTAGAVARLERAGAIIIAKTNLHEFAWGTTSQNPHWGTVVNPRRPGKVAGGSSGGNAAALAINVGALALGSDTGGSVRIPSACCGTVGLKPGVRTVPLDGCYPLAPSFDTAGPMARTVEDCVAAYSVLSNDTAELREVEGVTVGVLHDMPPVSPHEPGVPPDGAGTDSLERFGLQIEEIGGVLTSAALATPRQDIVPIFLFEAAVSHRLTFPSRRSEYGPDLQLKLAAARAPSALDVYEARRELRSWRARAKRSLKVDALIAPVVAGDIPDADAWEPDVRLQMVAYSRVFNFLGWPAIAIGDVQLAAPNISTVLSLARAWENAFGGVARAQRVTGASGSLS